MRVLLLSVFSATAILGTPFGSQAVATDPPDVNRLSGYSVLELEQQLASIDRELPLLARFSLRNEVGAIGHRSVAHDSADAVEWVEVELGDTFAIDEVVLVPALRRDKDEGFRADGFPIDFQVTVGTAKKESELIAQFSAEDQLQPRVAPVIVPCKGVQAAWVRIEATRLSQRGFDGKYVFQLSEILVFSGQQNVALSRPVRTSSQGWRVGGAREDRFLVDGDLPYLMNSGQGTQSLPFIGVSTTDRPTTLTIDLLESVSINRMRLHGVDLSDTAPRSSPADFGLPRQFVVEGANQRDFKDRVKLFESQIRSDFDVSPIMIEGFEPSNCRYVRLKTINPYVVTRAGVETTRIGFAELEVLSKGQNVALGKPVTAENASMDPLRPLDALTDGRNLYGTILPVRDWLEQLARRHDLEVARPIVSAELNTRYARQKRMLYFMQWLAAMLVAGLALTFVLSSRARRRKVAALRKRFAADLHDELGANLHTIGLLSDLAQQSRDSPEELESLHAQIRTMTTRSAAMVRNWDDMEHTEELCTELVSDMQRAAERIVVNLQHEFRVNGQANLERLNSQTRADVLLFYKECLINICRHAEATQLRTELSLNATELRLAVVDNGRGLSAQSDDVPASLRRRAQLLGADISVECPVDGGTGILLTLPIRRHHC